VALALWLVGIEGTATYTVIDGDSEYNCIAIISHQSGGSATNGETSPVQQAGEDSDSTTIAFLLCYPSFKIINPQRSSISPSTICALASMERVKP